VAVELVPSSLSLREWKGILRQRCIFFAGYGVPKVLIRNFFAIIYQISDPLSCGMHFPKVQRLITLVKRNGIYT
jgi:hypothetical protein